MRRNAIPKISIYPSISELYDRMPVSVRWIYSLVACDCLTGLHRKLYSHPRVEPRRYGACSRLLSYCLQGTTVFTVTTRHYTEALSPQQRSPRMTSTIVPSHQSATTRAELPLTSFDIGGRRL